MYKNILVPVLIGEDHDTQPSFLAARTLADEGANFTVLHVMEAIPSFVATQLPKDALDRSRDHAEKALIKSAAALPGASTHLAVGHAGRFIVDYAEEHGVDCIIIASHRPGIEDYFLGSTAARVVRHAQCAVHVIR
ncbi:universal stress protein [Nitratireductor sp. XY-223]|uniref:universal stress protein n=1 Tax=Nitratireductor sp. XY-223 TaxID=2561926 RepID=UPI0010AA6A3B|nr:universal stress protein [Nitratireductor sp. XY-223]